MTLKAFTILKRKQILQNPYLPVEEQEVLLPNGSTTTWYRILSKNAVVIIPITPTGEVLLEKTYKHGCGEIIYEFPAGIIDEGESPLEAAKRELAEEIGYHASSWELLGETFSNPTSSTMKHIYFLAKDAMLTHPPKREPTEQIELVSLPSISKVKEFLTHPHTLTSSSALSAITFYESFQARRKRKKN